DVLELDQAGRTGPGALLGVPAAVVLQGDRAGRRHAGELGVLDDRLAVELDPEAVALHGDLARGPLPAAPVPLLSGRYRGLDPRRRGLLGAVAPRLAAADRPHPDVDLGVGLAAQVDAGVHVLDLDLDLLAVFVLLVRAVGQDDRHLVQVALLGGLEPP